MYETDDPAKTVDVTRIAHRREVYDMLGPLNGYGIARRSEQTAAIIARFLEVKAQNLV